MHAALSFDSHLLHLYPLANQLKSAREKESSSYLKAWESSLQLGECPPSKGSSGYTDYRRPSEAHGLRSIADKNGHVLLLLLIDVTAR